MTWLAAHPSNTVKVRIPDEDGAPLVEVGFWPPRIAERIAMTMATIRKAKTPDELGVADPQFMSSVDRTLDVVLEMARWGIRGWEGAGLEPPVLEMETLDGVAYPRLSPASLALLCVNKLHGLVADRAWSFNVLTEDQKKRFGLPSLLGGSRSATGVASVTPPGTEDRSEESSGLMESPSSGVR